MSDDLPVRGIPPFAIEGDAAETQGPDLPEAHRPLRPSADGVLDDHGKGYNTALRNTNAAEWRDRAIKAEAQRDGLLAALESVVADEADGYPIHPETRSGVLDAIAAAKAGGL